MRQATIDPLVHPAPFALSLSEAPLSVSLFPLPTDRKKDFSAAGPTAASAGKRFFLTVTVHQDESSKQCNPARIALAGASCPVPVAASGVVVLPASIRAASRQ